MFILKNKLVSALIAINIIFFAIIYHLLTKNNNSAVDTTTEISQPATTAIAEVAEPAAAVPPVESTDISDTQPEAAPDIAISNPAPPPEEKVAESISQSIQRVVNTDAPSIPVSTTEEPSNTVTKQETTNEVEVFYDGNIVRMEETDSEGNRHTTISNSLDDIGKLSKNDSDYVSALNELKRGSSSHVSFKTTSQITAKNQTIKARSTNDSVDHFNKVDVSKQNVTSIKARRMSLAQQIENVLSEEENMVATNSETDIQPETENYIAALDVASEERANEMRTITVKRGDTLWILSRRAYGTGFQYPKIYKANPHLTNPNKIEVGDVLRVPL